MVPPRPAPPGPGPAIVEVPFTPGNFGLPVSESPLIPHRTPEGITFMDGDRVAYTYNGLVSWDADGTELPSRMELVCRTNGIEDCAAQLVVDDAHARYPVTIDPFIREAVLRPEWDHYSIAGSC